MNKSLAGGMLVPKTAVIIYSEKRSTYAPNYYLECAEIKKEGNQYVMQAAQPCTDEVMRKVALTYAKTSGVSMVHASLIGAHILMGQNTATHTAVMWWRPAQMRLLNFDKQLKIKEPAKGQKMPVPATLFLLLNTTLYCFALAGNQRPTAKTKLYNAPFFNLYEGGNVCLGSANVGKQKTGTFEGEAQRYETGFFLAEQNMLHNNASKIPLNQLWSNLIAQKARTYPVKLLVPHKKHKTVADLITNLVDKHYDPEDAPLFNDDDLEEMELENEIVNS
jgi:PRTRC genetic system protein B